MQRKIGPASTRGPTADEKRFMRWVKEQEFCCACYIKTYIEVDHAYGATYKHLKTLVGHWFLLPLCTECHQSKSINGTKGFIEEHGPLGCLWLKLIEHYDAPVPRFVTYAITDMANKGK